MFEDAKVSTYVDETNQTVIANGNVIMCMAVECTTQAQLEALYVYYKDTAQFGKRQLYINKSGKPNCYGIWIRKGEIKTIFTNRENLEYNNMFMKTNVPILTFDEFEDITNQGAMEAVSLYELLGMEVGDEDV